jgi:hypothetical protein
MNLDTFGSFFPALFIQIKVKIDLIWNWLHPAHCFEKLLQILKMTSAVAVNG